MLKPDMAQLKADAFLKKEAAKGKIEAAKAEAIAKKAAKKNPPPQIYQMPEQTGDAEADSLADLDAVQKGFRDRMKEENDRFQLATDSEYWACICFQTREQKEAFLTALDIIKFGDKYLDGQKVAEALKIQLPESKNQIQHQQEN